MDDIALCKHVITANITLHAITFQQITSDPASVTLHMYNYVAHLSVKHTAHSPALGKPQSSNFKQRNKNKTDIFLIISVIEKWRRRRRGIDAWKADRWQEKSMRRVKKATRPSLVPTVLLQNSTPSPPFNNRFNTVSVTDRRERRKSNRKTARERERERERERAVSYTHLTLPTTASV